MLSSCRNEIIASGASSWPRSCSTCKLGPCTKGYTEMLTPNDKYAVIHTKEIHHEGDERSRTHPGHGYPAWTEKVEEILRFKSLDDLKAWIIKAQFSHTKYEVIRYTPMKVSTEVVVRVA